MIILSELIITLFLFILVVAGLYLIYSLAFSTPFYPSRTKKLNQAFDFFVKSGFSEFKNIQSKRFVDLGSGDGRTVIWASTKGMNAEGIELNPFLTLFSKLLILGFRIAGKLKNSARIYNKSFYKHDFSKYDIAYLYIYPEHMEKIKETLMTQLPKGSIIITNTFTFKDLEPKYSFERFYVYTTQ